MRTVGLLANLDKANALEITGRLVDWLGARGIKAVTQVDVAAAMGRASLGLPVPALVETADLLVVLGGDGTLLNAARLAAGARPILGVNLGRLGFLTEIEVPDLFGALGRILDGYYVIEERMMLAAEVLRRGETAQRVLALNEVVVSKGPFARLIHLETYVGQHYVTTYPADGVIVATPTGSTAYSLSAGGPIVNPNLDVLIITPVCPHTFYSRALVVDHRDTVRIRLRSTHRDIMLTLDGQKGYALEPDDEVNVGRAPQVTRLVRLPDWNFYGVLRRKLREGPSPGEMMP